MSQAQNDIKKLRQSKMLEVQYVESLHRTKRWHPLHLSDIG